VRSIVSLIKESEDVSKETGSVTAESFDFVMFAGVPESRALFSWHPEKSRRNRQSNREREDLGITVSLLLDCFGDQMWRKYAAKVNDNIIATDGSRY
jgi:hypothetical protein